MNQLSFESPSKFLFTLAVTLLTLSLSTIFIATDKLLPIQMSIEEKLLMAEAQLTVANLKKQPDAILLAKANFQAQKNNSKELSFTFELASFVSIWSLRIGAATLLFSLISFAIEFIFRIARKNP